DEDDDFVDIAVKVHGWIRRGGRRSLAEPAPARQCAAARKAEARSWNSSLRKGCTDIRNIMIERYSIPDMPAAVPCSGRLSGPPRPPVLVTVRGIVVGN
ncbi:MAG: hypothetical protein P8Z80_08440, partial [Pseudolabrys sp.]